MLDPYPLVKPIFMRLGPERAHELTLRALETGLVRTGSITADPIVGVELFGRRLAHPLGLAAGFDKNARVFERMFGLGFSHVEIGGVTPRPQTGNPRPRVFRLAADGAVINRMGFPNAGADAVEARVRRRAHAGGMLGINLAANADAADPVADFVALATRFAPLADYLTLDISCPNTANGRMFLKPARLRELLAAVGAALAGMPRPALVAKLSPDIDRPALVAIVAELTAARIDGIIVSNTTVARPALGGPHAGERGGLSGRPLFAASTALLADVARLTERRIPLIGVGGISSGADAYAKIRAGATALQLYTALIYHGPALVARIVRELALLLRQDGFTSLAEAAA